MQQALDWDDLRILLAVGRSGSLAEASKALRVDRATVMRRLDGLEERLGAHLVRRSRDGCSLTDLGAAVLDKLEAIEDQVGAVRAAAAGTDETLEGVVRITAPEWLSYAILAEELGALRRAQPGLSVELLSTNQILSVTKREADIAIRNVKPHQSALVVRKLRDFAFALYAARVTWESVKRLDWHERDIVNYEPSMSYMPGYKWLAERVPAERVALRVSEALPMLAAVRSGLGIACLPCALGDRERELVRVPPGIVTRFDVWMVTHEDLLRQKRVRLVVDFLADVFARHARLLSGVTPPRARRPAQTRRPPRGAP